MEIIRIKKFDIEIENIGRLKWREINFSARRSWIICLSTKNLEKERKKKKKVNYVQSMQLQITKFFQK